MKVVHEKIMPPKSGYALEVKNGQRFRVTDLEGKQVVDMALFNLANLREKLSTSYSRTRYVPKPGEPYIPRDKLLAGDTLMSTICRPMMTIIEETPEIKGMHDTHNRMCNRYLYEQFGFGPRDGCHENIANAIAPWGLLPEDVPDTMDLFMNYYHDCKVGRWHIGEPCSKPGDYIEFEATMDLLIGLSNCPLDVLNPCNGYNCTPVKISVFEKEKAAA